MEGSGWGKVRKAYLGSERLVEWRAWVWVWVVVQVAGCVECMFSRLLGGVGSVAREKERGREIEKRGGCYTTTPPLPLLPPIDWK
jgi:hypothetical protein